MGIVTPQEHLEDLAMRYRLYGEDIARLDADACRSKDAEAFSEWACCPEHLQLRSRSRRFSEEAKAYPVPEGTRWCVPLSSMWWEAHGFQVDELGPLVKSAMSHHPHHLFGDGSVKSLAVAYSPESLLVRIVLDIIRRKGGAGWYGVCKTVPSHPWFVDFSEGDGYHALQWCAEQGYLSERVVSGHSRYTLTESGRSLLEATTE